MSNFDLLAAKIAAEPPEEIARVLRRQFDRIARLEIGIDYIVERYDTMVSWGPDGDIDMVKDAIDEVRPLMKDRLREEPK